MSRKITYICLAILTTLLSLPAAAYALENKVNAQLFYGEGCPHCAKERQYLSETLTKKYPELDLNEYEIYHNKDNVLLFEKVVKFLGAENTGVPFLIIGDAYFVGYSGDISPLEIEAQIQKCLSEPCTNKIDEIINENKQIDEEHSKSLKTQISDISKITQNPSQLKIDPLDEANTSEADGHRDASTTQISAFGEKHIDFPIIGNINVHSLSIPALTIALGLLDGFNPCALWTLLFLISLLLGMQDRKRMWTLGLTFIVASASVYFVFMSAWLNLILFLGYVSWIKITVGILALVGGSYSLKEFLANKNSGCAVSESENKKQFFERLKNIVRNNSIWVALTGIAALACAVNVVELACSAGLPAIYTQVLTINHLPTWQYYLYIILYVFIFMIDDLFVFFAAMVTLEMTGITTKYSRVSRLVGGIVMLIIGFLLIFKPELLMFG